ncbi:MAG: hypothetical protein LUG85_01105 [Clostridiales bacterium]|nr:hypothetical protein [Clostridiales bacterium]
MFKAKLSEEAINFLCKKIGKKLVSVELGESEAKFSRSYGNIRINFEENAIDLSNLEKPTPFLGKLDDISGFSAKIEDRNKPFVPYLNEKTHTIEINEKITSITVVNDNITINNGKWRIEFDEAIIIKTEENVYMISRDWQYSEIIQFSGHGNYDKIYPINSVIENQSNFGEFSVDVQRTGRDVTQCNQ